MNICFVTSECVPFVKTGGLADVSGALPRALDDMGGHAVKMFLPLYDRIRVFDHGFVPATDLDGSHVTISGVRRQYGVWYGHLPESDVEVYLIDCPHYYHRRRVYTEDPDEGERFALLQHAAFQIMQRYHWHPDIIHAHDWQAALMPALLKHAYSWDGLFHGTGTVLTIHNIGYQGLFAPALAAGAGLPGWEAGLGGMLEFSGAFSFLKSGIVLADRITTVSPTYAREIRTPEYGEGLEELLTWRESCVSGILNGIDTNEWNPATDQRIYRTYSMKDVGEGKWANKQALLSQFGLEARKETPVFGIVSRFAPQKGLDLLFPILVGLLDRLGFQLIVLGSGDSRTEKYFRNLAGLRPESVGTYIGYNEDLAHQIEAGADLFLMPSTYEPCGLNQMYSLRYGTVPVVRKTGGLADTVIDVHEHPGAGNGFSFQDARPDVVAETIRRAVSVFGHRREWSGIQERGMATDFSWRRSARAYRDLFRSALTEPC